MEPYRRWTRGLMLSVVVGSALGLAGAAAGDPPEAAPGGGPVASPSTQASSRAQVLSVYGRVPLSFEANQGQSDPQV